MPSASSPESRIRLTLVAASLLVALGIAEIAARVLTPVPWFLGALRQRTAGGPSQRVGPILEQVRRPLEASPDENEFRVLFLGDSFTYGSGLESDEGVFVRRIEQMLGRRPPTPLFTRFTAFNGGIPGSLTRDWVELLAAARPGFAPHLVVAVFFLRDGQHLANTYVEMRLIRNRLKEAYDNDFLFRHSRFYSFIRQGIEQQRLGREYMLGMSTGYLGSPEETREWKRAQINLLELDAMAKERGARFAVAVFPLLFGLDAFEYPLQPVVDAIEHFCRRSGIPVFSLLGAFRGMDGPSLWVSANDQHPNERAHKIAAQGMLPFVESLIQPVPATPVPDEEPPQRIRAAGVSQPRARTGEEDLDRWIEALASSRRAVASDAENRLVAAGDRAIPSVAAALQDPERVVSALSILGRMGPKAGTAAPSILRAMAREDLRIRRDGARILEAMGDPALATLIESLSVPELATAAASALARFGPRAAPATTRLVELLTMADATQLRAVLEAIGEIGPPAESPLLRAIESPSAAVRLRAAQALGYLGPVLSSAGAQRLARALGDEDADVRAAAARGLWQVVPASEAVVESVRDARDHPDREVRFWALRALEELAGSR